MRVHDLVPGSRVRIKRTFQDFDGRSHLEGTVLTLASHDVFAYDGGHTLRFTDGTVIRLAAIDPADDALLCDRDDVYWELVP